MSRLLALDCSTNSVGFALFEDKNLEKYGEVFFTGKNLFDRMLDAKFKIKAVRKDFQADTIVFEAATFIQNKKTVINLAYFYGTITSEFAGKNTKVVEANILNWQNKIGNPPLTKIEKEDVKLKFPGKSDSWYKGKYRLMRKQRTVDWANKEFNINVQSDNICDALGIGWGYLNGS